MERPSGDHPKTMSEMSSEVTSPVATSYSLGCGSAEPQFVKAISEPSGDQYGSNSSPGSPPMSASRSEFSSSARPLVSTAVPGS